MKSIVQPARIAPANARVTSFISRTGKTVVSKITNVRSSVQFSRSIRRRAKSAPRTKRSRNKLAKLLR